MFKSCFHRHCKNFYKYTFLVDFIKILIKELNPQSLEANNQYLDFFEKLNLTTGEILTKNRTGQKVTPYKNAFYKNLEFKIYDTGTITMEGSLHKYWNNGEHNYNDFNEEAFCFVINDLQTKFNIDFSKCRILCIEIGLNIKPPKPTNEILEYCFLHKTKPFEFQKNSNEGKYKQCEHTQYIIKIYNKALHYSSKGFNINTEIMRFEIKYKKMERLNKLGVYTLTDVLNKGYSFFKDELLTEWQNVLFYDTTINSNSTRIVNYKNPIYWNDLTKRNTLTTFYKHKKILNELTINNSKNIQNKVSKIMSEKITFLNKGGASFDHLYITSKHAPLHQKTTPIKTPKTTNEINTKNIVCRVTGIGITMQKENSIYISHSGLKYYLKNDKKVFEQLKRKYLPTGWNNSNIETQIKRLAHNIRNVSNNQKIKQNRIYKPQQTNLLMQMNI